MDLKIVRFVHLNEYLTGVFMFKWKNTVLPCTFDVYFVYSSVHSCDTRILAFNERLKQQFDFSYSLTAIKYKIKTALLIKKTMYETIFQ